MKITSSFYISETEVTLAQFRKFRPDFVAVPGSELYVSGVSWHDAVAFCEWLSRAEGTPYRLPTEAEWEILLPCRLHQPVLERRRPPGAGSAKLLGTEEPAWRGP